MAKIKCSLHADTETQNTTRQIGVNLNSGGLSSHPDTYLVGVHQSNTGRVQGSAVVKPSVAASWAEVVATSDRTDNGDFTMVPTRKQPRPRPSALSSGILQSVQDPTGTTNGRDQRIIGTKDAGLSIGIKSGVKIVKKTVLHVDNVNMECTPDALKSFLSDNNIEVLSCFTAKSWLRESERNSVSAFRVCVAAVSKDKITSPDLWPAGVIIRSWVFKKLNNGSES
jgi:hypothetical protein